jgi:hypothetical protein
MLFASAADCRVARKPALDLLVAAAIDRRDGGDRGIQTVDDPAKEAKYTKSFTLFVGGEELQRSKADALEAELKPLVGGPIVAQMFRYDTDPSHSPHPHQAGSE